MKNFNIYTGAFSHAHSSTWYKKPKDLIWDFNTNKNSVSFYVDGNITLGFNHKNDGKKKFLWGLESKFFNNNFFDIIKNNLDKVLETYELIFTYNQDLLKLDNKFKWVPAMGTWIESPKLNEKSKLVSMITSDKQMTQNQKFRVSFANENKEKIDLYGNSIKPIKKKEFGLNDYMFSVCIENDTSDTYFTEKILDCFATGTIPIYVGTKKIVEHFDSNGIIFLDNNTLDEINYDLFLSKKESILENFERVKSFNTVEDYFYDKYLKDFL
jgi:hypothetical protein